MGRCSYLLMAACVVGFASYGSAGESPQPSPKGSAAPAESQKQFDQLYKEFSARFYAKMVRQAENLTPAQISAEAAAVWQEVFGGHADLLARRSAEILAQLEPASGIDESQYFEVFARAAAPDEKPENPVPKHLVWSPVGAATRELDAALVRVLGRAALNARMALMANAEPRWEALDRSVEKPRLVQHHGPCLFIVDLSRKDDYYRVEKIRWLRPKSMGPVAHGRRCGETPAECEPKPPPRGRPASIDIPSDGPRRSPSMSRPPGGEAKPRIVTPRPAP